MSKYYESKQFKKLQKEWYNKIASTGFEDVELFNETFGNAERCYLKRPSFKWALKWDSAILEHFRIARNFLAHGIFASDLDKKIWELYTEGLSIRQIASKLTKEGLPHSAFPIFTRLKTLKVQMYLFNKQHESELDNE